MPLLSATVLTDAVINATDRMTRHERRLNDTDVIGVFYEGTNSLVNEARVVEARASARRPTQIPVLQRHVTPLRTTRRIVEDPTMSTSEMVNLTWSTVGFEVGRQEAVNADNYIEAVADLGHQIEQGIRTVIESLDATGVTTLNAARNASLQNLTGLDGVTVVSNSYQVPNNKFFPYLPTIMRKNAIQGPYTVISNIEALATLTEMSTFGTYNQQNLEKLAQNYRIGYSSAITPEAGSSQKSFVFPTDSVGMLQWTEYDCRVGRTYDLLQYYEMPIDITTPTGINIKLNFGVKYSAGAKDLSAKLSGLERAFAETWGLYVDVAFITEYSSDDTSPIVKFDVAFAS